LNPMLRNDRALYTIAGLICSAAGIKNKAGKVLEAHDFDVFNRDPENQKPLTADDFMRVLGRKG